MNRGFTLIETLIYVAIIGMVLTSFVLFSLSVSDPTEKSYSIEEVNANLRHLQSMISGLIRGAGSVDTIGSSFNTDNGYLLLGYPNPNNPTSIGLNEFGQVELKRGSNASTTLNSEKVVVTRLNFLDTSPIRGIENITYGIEMSYYSTSSNAYNTTASATTSVSLRR